LARGCEYSEDQRSGRCKDRLHAWRKPNCKLHFVPHVCFAGSCFLGYTCFVHKPLTVTARAAAVLFVLAFLPSLMISSIGSTSRASGPGGHGCKEGNLIPNCGMDQFVPVAQGQAPSGWTPFVLSGGLAMDPSPDTFWGAPSLRMWSDGGTFVAGVYAQVGGLTPGATYTASVGWFAPTEPDAFGRRLGIDPTGGTDPYSPNVVWGPMLRGPGKVLNDSNPGYPNIDITAVAKGPTVTVFAWVDHNYSTGPNQIFLDALGLYQDAAPVVPVATSTPPPPAATQPAAPATTAAPAQTKRPPTVTPTATATQTTAPAATATPTATDTPSPTAPPTLTPTPLDTATPSVTPSSTLPARPRATAAPAVSQVASRTEAPRALLFGGLGALAGAGLLSVGVLLRRRD
jgi:hypothetical protein